MTDIQFPAIERTPLQRAAAGGRAAYGFFTVTGESELVEAFAVVGADFTVLDMEAAPMAKRDLVHCLQALNGSACSGLVRVPWLETHYIEHALDLGAHGVVVPKVDSADQAGAAVAAAFYAPLGRRGINPVRASAYFTALERYLATANELTTLLLQIESGAAVEAVDEIAAVPGVSGLFIGPGDLAADYGHPGVVVGADMDRARAAVLAACRRNGIAAGIFAYDMDLAARYAAEGFQIIAIGNEIKMLKDAAVAQLARARGDIYATAEV
jgi:2-keto-3-deoxy-L-rhamnonate aldolase RhmA